jgi:hypothetical protein
LSVLVPANETTEPAVPRHRPEVVCEFLHKPLPRKRQYAMPAPYAAWADAPFAYERTGSICRSARAGRRVASDRAAGSRSASVIQQVSEPAAESGLIQARAFLTGAGFLARGSALGGVSPPPSG